jgi:hypothetical protein
MSRSISSLGLLAESPYRLKRFFGRNPRASLGKANPEASQWILEGGLQTYLWVACYVSLIHLDLSSSWVGLDPARELLPSRRAAIMLSRFHGKTTRDNKETARSCAHRQGDAYRSSPAARSARRLGYVDRRPKRIHDSPGGDTGHDGNDPAHPGERHGREAGRRRKKAKIR